MTLAPERTGTPTAPTGAAAPGAPGPAIGRAVDRVDGLAKTTGTARFSAEYPLPGLTHAVLVHSTIARGRITSLDTARADPDHRGVVRLTEHIAPQLTHPRNH
jgi:xanthine dehydrogenase YagR molybdenum-binding subunit